LEVSYNLKEMLPAAVADSNCGLSIDVSRFKAALKLKEKVSPLSIRKL
jgi:hypothetical protein